MGILHKLVWILRKVDPENKIWFESIIKRLPTYAQPEMRKKLEGENWDYLWKLGVVQQSVYGVDIQPIAIQIAKLRFFISLLVDQDIKGNEQNNFGLLPLPNLDFKLVSANTLIGAPENYSRLPFAQDEFFDTFNKLTGQYFGTYEPTEKKKLSKKIENLISGKVQEKIDEIQRLSTHTDERFSKYLAEKNKAIIEQKKNDAKLWKSYSNLFKHESVGFFEIKYFFPEVKEGFDVVIGNPPYGGTYPSEYKEYFQANYESAKTITGRRKGSLDTFSLFIDRGLNIADNNSTLTYIVPMAVTSSDSMTALHNMMFRICETIYISTYSNRPKKIFDNADQRVAIIWCQKNGKPTKYLFTTKVNKRYEDTSVQKVINGLQYVNSFPFVKYGRIPKVGTDIELSILGKIYKSKTTLSDLFDEKGKPVYYRSSGGRYYNIITNFSTGSTKEKSIVVKSKYRDLITAILSSNLYFWFYHIYSNNLDLKSYELEIFPIPIENFSQENIENIEGIYNEYLKDLHKHSKLKKVNYVHVSEYREYYARYSKNIIDKIDMAIKEPYNLTDEEINFIINYDLKFRIDDDEEDKDV